MQELVEADGAALEFVALDQGSLSLRLVLDGVDCVTPRDYLEPLALNVARKVDAGVERVRIDDPREHGEAAAPPG